MKNNTIPGRIALELDYNVGYCKMIKLWKIETKYKNLLQAKQKNLLINF
jgi:hypothetical protein